MAIKVTFYNDVNFELNAKADKSTYNASIKPDSGSFSDGGIYFTPLQNITNPEKPAPAHIIQKSYIYTLGSYVINDPSVNELSITSANTGTTTDKLTQHDCHVVTDITSDPYNKLLTVKKTNIKLGSIVNTVTNAAEFIGTLGKQSKSINLGNYSLTVSISSDGILSLTNGEILNDTITAKYQKGSGTLTTFKSGDEFQLSKDVYTLQFTTNTDIATASIASEITAAKDITFGTSKLSCEYHKNNNSINTNVVKVLIPASGWDADSYTSDKYTFIVSITTTGGTKENVKYNEGNFTIKLVIAKTPSPLVLNEPSLTVSSTQQTLHKVFTASNTSDSTGDALTWEMTTMTPASGDTASNWGSFDSTNDKYTMGSAYHMKKEKITVNYTYLCTVNKYSIYHEKSKQGKLTISGGKKWTLNFNSQGGDAVEAQSKYYGTAFSIPTTLNKQKNGAISYTFKGWYTAATGGTQVKSLSPEGTAVTWKDHAATLYAQWTETQDVKYYWYVGKINPAEMTSINVNDGWTECTSQKQTPIVISKQNADYSTNIWYIAAPYNWGYTLYNATGAASAEAGYNISEVTLNGVKYKVWTSKAAGYQAVGQLIIK